MNSFDLSKLDSPAVDIENSKLMANKILRENTENSRAQLQNLSKDHISYLESYHNHLADYENSLQIYNTMRDALEEEIVQKKITISEKKKALIENKSIIEAEEYNLSKEKSKLNNGRDNGHIKWKNQIIFFCVAILIRFYFYLYLQSSNK